MPAIKGIILLILMLCKPVYFKTSFKYNALKLIPAGYKKDIAPLNDGASGKTKVSCNHTLIGITKLSAKAMEIEVETMLEFTWADNRLNKSYFKQNPGTNFLTIHKISAVLYLWFPDFKFQNCKHCDTKIINGPTIKYNYTVDLLSTKFRHTNTYPCTLDMTNYPFDIQTCSVEITTDDTKPVVASYFNTPNPYVTVPPEWTLFNITTSPSSEGYQSFTYHLRRNRSRPIVLIFIPSCLIVILSWLSFWLDPNAAAPRISLGVTSLLTLTTQFGAFQFNLPAVSTVMALDVWMFACILNVFASLFEYAIVNFLQRSLTKPTKLNRRNFNVKSSKYTIQESQLDKMKTVIQEFRLKLTANYIDKTSRFLFPTLFIVFNFYFWITYY